ncbi:hypothetical protein DQ238_10475 [Geodermatophilus sp. TF02-6]|uniref:hypothetical protein n=1 Tax=Geodermatophilus sp. TF02-6 TaxID=2250575 RepID=UPI000DFD23C4|nr:hypothetical protein [Geodermatophilus sp. TF02-6]RBY79605.1 hypothetical protein DQ238_10475 [Geodermatophilus sp. TF02-6]
MSSPGLAGLGLLQRLRPRPVTVADLRRAAEEVLPALATDRLRLAVVEDRADGPVLVAEEAERRLRVPLRELAEDMTDARVGATPGQVAVALTAWVADRPVCDADAEDAGIAVLDWTDRTQTAVGWRVVVRRGGRALPWTPSPAVDRRAAERIRTAAAGRAAALDGNLRVEGPVALWSHPEVPLLASAVLVAPRRLLDRIAAAGLEVSDLHVVVTPHSPLACADAGVAVRLAGESGEACQRLPWGRFPRLPWI